MGFPAVKTARVDKLVTSLLLTYKNQDYIADQILPLVGGLKDDSGIIPTLLNSGMRIYNGIRALFDEGQHRIEFKYSLDKRYDIQYHDLEVYLPDRLIEQAEQPFMPRRDASFVLQQALMTEREVGLARAMTDVTVITNNVTLSGADQWQNYDTSSPEEDIQTALDSVFDQVGMEANAVVMSRRVMNVLKRHPFFLDLAKRNAGDNVKNINTSQFIELFKTQFDVKYVFIGRAKYINSQEGQTETRANVWNNDFVAFHRADSPSLMAPSFGYQFSLGKYNKRVTTRRHQNDTGDILKIEWAYQDKILQAEGAYLIKNATNTP